MNFRKLLSASAIAVASTVAMSGSVFADTVWHYSNGEGGMEFRPSHATSNKSNKSRAEVQAETKLARDFGAGRVSPDGWRYVGGERGWVNEGHQINFVDGKWVHTDKIDKTPAKPSPKMTAKEQAEFDMLYRTN